MFTIVNIIGVALVMIMINHVILFIFVTNYGKAFRLAFFMNWATRFISNLGHPSCNGVKFMTRNFYLTVNKDIKIGVWHTLPKGLSDSIGEKSLSSKKYRRSFFENCIRNYKYRIVIYCHGAFGYRGNTKSISVANVIASKNCHVFMLDYRGYADSTGDSNEEGFYEDLRCLYTYVYRLAPGSVYIWGHSMGAAVACKVAGDMCNINKSPKGLMLESGFTTAFDAFIYFPFNTVYRSLSYVYKYIAQRCDAYCLRMRNIDNILNVTCPITLVHAKDDWVVPFFMSQQLYIVANEAGKVVRMFIFNDDQMLGHSHIITAPEFLTILDLFLEIKK
uniref:Hydrolase_4 domain-containing protein n=1 Tax=Parastrongyloides trichosuri TaxID=131310 RepID=A0A0N4ZDT5_PARTI